MTHPNSETPSPATLLREAAASMRRRAEAATFTAYAWEVDEVGAVWAEESDGQPIPVSIRSTDADAEHIACWHPAVALSVADWLDQAADDLSSDPDSHTYAEDDLHPCIQKAIASARAYLGRVA